MVVTMTCSTATDCLCHIWSRIFFLQPSQSPPSSFMNYRQVWIITRWLTWVTRRMPLVEQELIIHLYVINCSILSFLWCICRPMFGVFFFPVLIFPLYSFDFQILSTPFGLCKPLLIYDIGFVLLLYWLYKISCRTVTHCGFGI